MSKGAEQPIESKDGEPLSLFVERKSERGIPPTSLSPSLFEFSDQGLKTMLTPFLEHTLPKALTAVSLTGKRESLFGVSRSLIGDPKTVNLETRTSHNDPAFVEAQMRKQGLTPAASGEFLRYLHKLGDKAEKGNRGKYKTYVCTIPLPPGYVPLDPTMMPGAKEVLEATWYLSATWEEDKKRWEVVPMQAEALQGHEHQGTRFVFVGIRDKR